MITKTNKYIFILFFLIVNSYVLGQCGHSISIGKTPLNEIEFNVWPGSLYYCNDDSIRFYIASNNTKILSDYNTFIDSIEKRRLVVLKETNHDQYLIYSNINRNLGEIFKNQILLTMYTQEIRLGSYSNSKEKSRLDTNLLAREFIWIHLIDTMMNKFKIINGLRVKSCTHLTIGYSIFQNLKDSQFYVENIDRKFVRRYNKTWISTGAAYKFKYDGKNNFMREKSKSYVFLDYFKEHGDYAVFNSDYELRFIRLNSDSKSPVYDKSVHPVLKRI